MMILHTNLSFKFCSFYLGFTGKNCSESFDPCSLNYCTNNSTCVNVNSLPGGFYCICSASFSGEFCQDAVDFCDSSNNNGIPVCLNGGVCTSLKNTFKCACKNGKDF